MEAAHVRHVHEHNELMRHAWTIAALSRQRRLQDMRSLMIRPRSTRRQTWQEQMAVCRGIAAAYGGLH